MGQSKSSSANQNTVVIRMSWGVFYGLVGTLLGAAALVVAFWLGVQLARSRNAGQVIVQQPAYSTGQPYAAQPVAPQPAGAVQPQAATSSQSGPFASGPPAGKEVPIGDNPRLALPDLAQTNYVLDFGDVTVEQGPVTKEVRVHNDGVKDLVISEVQTTCSCTNAAVTQQTVPPGGDTILQVTHDPQVMLNHGSTNIAHQVLINSNDPAAPWVEINLSGTVVQ